jgi:hypothetical protein
MLLQLHSDLGRVRLLAILGVPWRTVMDWENGKSVMSAAARRLVWVVWCYVRHPERIGTLEDWVTWGKLRAKAVESIEQVPESALPESVPR